MLLNSCQMQGDADIQTMRELIRHLPDQAGIDDFEEMIQLESVKATVRLWQSGHRLAGFAFVDDYNNLILAMDPELITDELETEIFAWGAFCMRERNLQTGRLDTLDASCSRDNIQRIRLLERHRFKQCDLRTLRYARSLDEPIVEYPLPPGFSLRCALGEHEAEQLAALHRAAFGSDHMMVEYRLAIMRAPQYDAELDLVVIDPNGEMAAFCICGLEEGQDQVGYTDPIGTHPRYQKMGLGKAVVTAGFQALRNRGVKTVELGTSSENIAMQCLAESLGFKLVSERLWFALKVD